MALGETAAGMGLGLIGGAIEDSRQLRQKRKTLAIEMQAAKEMSEFNREQQMRLWEDTNFDAQRKQMEKAGLSVGLMYKQGGPGGSIQAQPGNVSGGLPERANTLGMGMQLGMQLQMQKAQIENLQANTEKTKVEAAKTAGVDTAQVQANTEVAKHEAKLRDIEAQLKGETLWDAVEAIRNANDISEQQIRSSTSEADVAEGTQEERIKQINQQSAEQALRIAQQKADLKLTAAQITELAQRVANLKWQQTADKVAMSQRDYEIAQETRRINLQELITQFSTGNLAQAKMLTEIIGGLLGSATKAAESAIPRGGSGKK